jgi:hypothetical protein
MINMKRTESKQCRAWSITMSTTLVYAAITRAHRFASRGSRSEEAVMV